jgi:hypothetical protein
MPDRREAVSHARPEQGGLHAMRPCIPLPAKLPPALGQSFFPYRFTETDRLDMGIFAAPLT